MRRLLAILLLTVFSVPYASVFFASDSAEASIPICCRKDGKHHCAMMPFVSHQSNSISIISEKCPYTPAAPAALHLLSYAPSIGASVFAELVRHPAVHAQTQAKYRISSDRSRQKRGPPSLILL